MNLKAKIIFTDTHLVRKIILVFLFTKKLFGNFYMNVSSSSALMPLATSSSNKTEQLNEGTQPDSDHDQDDALQVAATTQNNSVGASGSVINTFA